MKAISVLILFIGISANIYSQVLTEVKCRMWAPEDYCVVPPSYTFHNVFDTFECRDCGLYLTECNKLNNPNLKGVSLTFKLSGVFIFNIEAKFKNIKIIRADGSTVFPEVLLYNSKFSDDLLEYITNIDSGCLESKLEVNRTYHLVMFFKKAEAGDKLVIDNFVNTVIAKE